MKYKEAVLLIDELRKKEVQRQKDRGYYTIDIAYLSAYSKGMEDIIHALMNSKEKGKGDYKP